LPLQYGGTDNMEELIFYGAIMLLQTRTLGIFRAIFLYTAMSILFLFNKMISSLESEGHL